MLESSSFDDSIVPLYPSGYTSLILPSPADIPDLKLYLHADHIRIAILDSPPDDDSQDPADPPPTAAMIVPRNRETDWVFSTEAGQTQLLSGAPGISRFILIGNAPSDEEFGSYKRPEGDSEDFLQRLEECLYPFLLNFLPKRSIVMKDFHITFVWYEDNVVNAVVLERFVGPVVGEMLVEDVEIEDDGRGREFRRRLRFKRMPNLIQTEIKIVPSSDSNSLSIRDMKFQPDLSALVHVYLAPMAASLSLASVHLQGCLDSKVQPKALCIGVGGGSLIGFLATQLDFAVVGVEIDQVVLNTARMYFGLEQCEKSVLLLVGDGIEFLKFPKSNSNLEVKVDVIMVDLDPTDFSDTSVPPWKFQHERVISAAKSYLCGAGLMVLNVIPPTKVDFEILVLRLRAEFAELYKIDIGNGENSIVIATMEAIDLSNEVPENAFMSKLKSLKLGEFMDKIEKI